MIGLIFSPVYRQIRDIISQSLGKQAKGLLRQVKRLWDDLLGSVDAMIMDSVGEFVHDSAMGGWPHRDYWVDKDGGGRYGMSSPIEDLERFVQFRAIQLGPSMIQQMRDPWFTLKQAGMTEKVQAEIVATLVKHRFSDTLKHRIGSVIGEFAPTKYVLVDIRLEAYKPLQGTPKLVKIGEMRIIDQGDASKTKRAFDKSANYERGEYDQQALLASLPRGKFKAEHS